LPDAAELRRAIPDDVPSFCPDMTLPSPAPIPPIVLLPAPFQIVIPSFWLLFVINVVPVLSMPI